MFAVASVAALLFASSALAQPSPLTPLPTPEGGNCVISWTPDATGNWTQTNIELMSGSNQNMVHLTTVTTVDTTSGSPATFTWTCPDVTIYSAIYWYQFSHALEPSNLLWTTRWAIESATGTVVAPPNPTQPGGQAVPWGLGELVDAAAAKPAPSYITGETSATGSNSTAAAVPGTISVAAVTTALPAIANTASQTMTRTTGAPSNATSLPAPAATSQSSTSAATALQLQGSIMVAGVGAALAGLLACF